MEVTLGKAAITFENLVLNFIIFVLLLTLH